MINPTEKILQAMLTENTGVRFMDSGGKNGRTWQRNQGIDFTKVEPITLSTNGTEIEISVSLFHWLKSRVYYDQGMQEKYEWYIRVYDDLPYLVQALKFAKYMRSKDSNVSKYDKIEQRYTSNYEHFLDQDFQFTVFPYHDDWYAIISIHGGAEARGGFTDNKVFKISDSQGLEMWYTLGCYHNVSLYCDHCDLPTFDNEMLGYNRYWLDTWRSEWNPRDLKIVTLGELRNWRSSEDKIIRDSGYQLEHTPAYRDGEKIIKVDQKRLESRWGTRVWIHDSYNGFVHCPQCGSHMNACSSDIEW